MMATHQSPDTKSKDATRRISTGFVLARPQSTNADSVFQASNKAMNTNSALLLSTRLVLVKCLMLLITLLHPTHFIHHLSQVFQRLSTQLKTLSLSDGLSQFTMVAHQSRTTLLKWLNKLLNKKSNGSQLLLFQLLILN